MPILADPRHERFAQLLASGLGATDAYEQAGYARHRQSASRLLAQADIRFRVTELLNASAVATVEVETAKRRAIRIAYERLAETISKLEIVTAQDFRLLTTAVLELEKDQRVVDGGVSDRTESGSTTNRLAEELQAANEWLKQLADHSATVSAKRAQIAEDVPPGA